MEKTMVSGDGVGKMVQTVGEFAARSLREFHTAIIQHESGVLRGDVDAIHDMRVGIRRMRVTLSNFSSCIPKEDRLRIGDSLKKLAESLGKVRDQDVLIASLRSKKRDLTPEDRRALSAFMKRLKARRRRNLKALSSYIRGEEFAALKKEFGEENPSTEGIQSDG